MYPTFPSEVETQRFWGKQSTIKSATVALPTGFPAKISSTLAWTKEDIEAKRNEWQVNLTGDDIVAIDAALADFEG